MTRTDERDPGHHTIEFVTQQRSVQAVRTNEAAPRSRNGMARRDALAFTGGEARIGGMPCECVADAHE